MTMIGYGVCLTAGVLYFTRAGTCPRVGIGLTWRGRCRWRLGCRSVTWPTGGARAQFTR
jgi:hypothetical protein